MKRIATKGNIVITGGGGFIGANLSRRLLELGYGVHLIWKKSSNPWRLQDIKTKIKFHTVDINDTSRLTTVMKKINPVAIFHLATFADYRDQNKISQMIETNVQGTANLLLATAAINYKIFVNTGSSSEYGFKKKSMKESDVLEPISFYAATKSGATLLSQAFAFYYKKPIVTFRPFSVYGPLEEPTRFIPVIAKALAADTSINLTAGSQRRDFIFVDDVVEAYVKSIRKGKKLSGQIINLGTGRQYTNDEVTKILFKVIGKKVPVNKGNFPARLWDSPYWVADVSKGKKLLGWVPKYTLERGLIKTYNWFTKKT